MDSKITKTTKTMKKGKVEAKAKAIAKLKAKPDPTIVKCGEYINMKFDTLTGSLISINDEVFEELKWFNIAYIVKMSTTGFGSIMAIKPPEMEGDDYPDALSFIILEKTSSSLKLEIKILVTLNIDETNYIKVQDILDIFLTDANNFWLIHKASNCIALTYYYKNLEIHPNYIKDYVKDNTIYNMSTNTNTENNIDVKYRYVSRIIETKCKYISFFANYEIPIFALIMENIT